MHRPTCKFSACGRTPVCDERHILSFCSRLFLFSRREVVRVMRGAACCRMCPRACVSTVRHTSRALLSSSAQTVQPVPNQALMLLSSSRCLHERSLVLRRLFFLLETFNNIHGPSPSTSSPPLPPPPGKEIKNGKEKGWQERAKADARAKG